MVLSGYQLDPDKDNYCVMGNPVGHSLSPDIHSMFAEQTGEAIYYQSMLVERDRFAQELTSFRERGGKGLNVTLPFKVHAFNISNVLTERARGAGAVNTIWFGEDGKVYGDNTDGVGLVTDITTNHLFEVTNRQVLILGAGGAVQGILGPLLNMRPARIVIANRTVSKADALAAKFRGSIKVLACGLDIPDNQSFDLVVNASSASLQAEVPSISANIFNEGAMSYDLAYAKEETTFQKWSRENGAWACLNGLGMLVEQAAESFQIWRGVKPETDPVIKRLRALTKSAG